MAPPDSGCREEQCFGEFVNVSVHACGRTESRAQCGMLIVKGSRSESFPRANQSSLLVSDPGNLCLMIGSTRTGPSNVERQLFQSEEGSEGAKGR